LSYIPTTAIIAYKNLLINHAPPPGSSSHTLPPKKASPLCIS